jgi:hypothetical protein
VPICVGVWRQTAAGEARWLAGSEFAPLAAGLGIDVDEANVVRRLPLDLTTKADGGALPSLSAFLARHGGAPALTAATDPPMARRVLGPVDTGGLWVSEYVPNFGGLDRLAWQRVSSTDPADVPELRGRLRGNLILLSDAEPGATDGEDVFRVPTRPGIDVPGAYVHACGAVTLLSGPPATPTPAGRAVLAALVMGVCGIVWWTTRHPPSAVGWTRLGRRFTTWLWVGAVALAGFVVMRAGRLAWPDLLYLVAGLLLVRTVAVPLRPVLESFIAPREPRS